MSHLFQVESIILYENYDPKTNQHDIALIKLKSSAQLTDTISTVCLWSGSADEKFIAEKTGLVKINIIIWIVSEIFL